MSLLRRILKALGLLLLLLLIGLTGYLAYASATAERRLAFPSAPYPKIVASQDPAAVERGRYLVYGPAHCSQCHAVTDREHPEKLVAGTPLSGGLEFAMGPIGSTWAANLTPDPETGIGRRSDAELARAIRTGVQHDGRFSFMMRFAAARLSDEDLADVLAFLRAQAPVRHAVPRDAWRLLGKAMLPFFPLGPRPPTGPQHVPAPAEPTLERGAYLVEHVALCGGCHTEVDMKTFEPTGPKAAGSLPDRSHGADADMEFVAPNLTSDPSGYTGRADEEAFLARLRSGRAITSSIMPWEPISRMSDVDLRSVYRYLRSLPPVHNDLGPSYRRQGWKPPG